jgi:hypothetical protein
MNKAEIGHNTMIKNHNTNTNHNTNIKNLFTNTGWEPEGKGREERKEYRGESNRVKHFMHM